MKQLKNTIGILLIAFAMTGCRGCEKDATQVPYVPINVNINVNLPAYINLTVPTGWEYLTGGANGLLVYRVSQDQFIVLDRQGTYDFDISCRVVVSDDNFTLSDPCSDSQWSIIDGSVLNGPTPRPLRSYNWSFNDPFLTISN